MRSFLLLLAALFVGATCAENAPFVGGYSDAPIDANATSRLATALGNDAFYGANVTTRVCFTKITSLQEQVVAGMNYKYNVTACEAKTAADGHGQCSSAMLATCAPKAFVITIYEQSWLNTTQVTSIEALEKGSTIVPKSDGRVVARAGVLLGLSVLLLCVLL